MGTIGRITVDVPAVCPACEGLVRLPQDAVADTRTGESILVPCTACGQDMKVAVPFGLDAYLARGGDRSGRAASEFIQLPGGAALRGAGNR